METGQGCDVGWIWRPGVHERLANCMRRGNEWKAKVIVDMAGCGNADLFDPSARSAECSMVEISICQYSDERGRMGLLHVELGRYTYWDRER